MQHHKSMLKEAVELSEPQGADIASELGPTLPSANTDPVRQLQLSLEQRLRQPSELTPGVAEPTDNESPPPQEMQAVRPKIVGRIIKAAVGLAILAAFGWMPVRTLLQASSVEAIVNSRVVTVRAPIEGDVVATSTDLASTGVLAANRELLRIVNVRADRLRLDGLEDRLAQQKILHAALQAKIASTRQAYDEVVRYLARFALGRTEQLEARAAQLQSEVAAARARTAVAAAAAGRALKLGRSDALSTAEVERLIEEKTIAEQTEISTERALDATNAELNAARDGTFLGDGANDRPSSAQRSDELLQRLNELTADLTAADAEIAHLERDVVDETARYRSFADVAISLPVTGRLWEVMTAPGEHVSVGQDLLKILDCSGAVVTANVTEAVYNRLSVGAPARFRPSDGGGDFQGTITNLTGLADAPANLAIIPSALSREAYRVTVRVPDLASGNSCAVGRTGRVIFDKAPAGAG